LKNHTQFIAESLNVQEWQVENTIKLLAEGSTVPFISRYRKEMTGTLDEVQVSNVRDMLGKLEEFDKRREAILHSIEEQGKMTDDLRQKITACLSLTELEDLYLPYKQKKKTKASIAREKGLEPLAQLIMLQQEKDIFQRAEEFINDKVETVKDALQGARDIIAENINENQRVREITRKHFSRTASIFCKVAKGKDDEGIKYKDYYSYEEPLKHCPSHRYLAMMRGEEEGFLKITIEPSREQVLEELDHVFIKGNLEVSAQMSQAVEDSYKRLLQPSIETEFRNLNKDKADEEAIRVFADNLRQLLLSPPLGQKRVLGIDPGFRTGCKIVCLDAQGNLLHNETIYPHEPQKEVKQAAAKINTLVNTYKIEAISIGNGTASRETEAFIKKIHFDKDIMVFVVSESGASIYSASSVAREEFPEYDVTVRGAVSIGRRLMDPLAELVKIEPKSIGVGQYQHDVDQNKLKKNLDEVVESCVNQVGVNVNTASKHLLTYVSGLGPQLALNIVEYRKSNGPFSSRSQLNKIPRLGDKAFEQCAGFLRIPNAENPLDNSAVHPESYHVVKAMAQDLGTTLQELISKKEVIKKIQLEKYCTSSIGIPTLKDIVKELEKPGLDPRTGIQVFEFDPNVHKIQDLIPGMLIPGIVTNITNFGAFVDVGVKQDGLVHISQLADKFVSNPAEVVKLNQHVKVKVLEVDVARKRISLSMKTS
jgi:protein Tex